MNNMGLNYMGPLICQFFPINMQSFLCIYRFSQLQIKISIHGWLDLWVEAMDTESSLYSLHRIVLHGGLEHLWFLLPAESPKNQALQSSLLPKNSGHDHLD
ncbi:unnamed protein product [Rangifer tarandus platyrhynchus]|uniref:Uncharacterized protein n=2 Tax=Rangifer tarandus platyrhynchus TaxID=3082113 RepID=A0ABN8ZRY5_RANTA|nr:unnamed protein product [Rangifer tarandus platyrhynchus]